jgi:hypothetical protein
MVRVTAGSKLLVVDRLVGIDVLVHELEQRRPILVAAIGEVEFHPANVEGRPDRGVTGSE